MLPPEACFDVYLAVNTVSISCKKIEKIKKIESFSNSGFGNTFPDQPIGHYIGKVLRFYPIRELYLNAGLGR
jgi:hypothetical protein